MKIKDIFSDQQGRNKTTPIYRWHDYLFRKSPEIYQTNKQKSFLELRNEYSKVTGYKVNIQKFIEFLYSNYEHLNGKN